MNDTRYKFWIVANTYAVLLGHRWSAPLHKAILSLSLHALGYDNARHTGEEWFIKKILAEADIQVCLDIGANVGSYSALLAEHTRAQIYAIEPSASSFAALEKKVARYPGRIWAINTAVSDTAGVGVLYSRSERSEKATLSKETAGDVPIKESVAVTTLDALVKEFKLERLDFIKIDTEGHEREVLMGAKETLARLRPKFIQFEFNHVHLYRGVTLYQLAQLLPGYVFYRLLPHGWLPIDPSKMSSNIFMFCNIVAKKK